MYIDCSLKVPPLGVRFICVRSGPNNVHVRSTQSGNGYNFSLLTQPLRLQRGKKKKKIVIMFSYIYIIHLYIYIHGTRSLSRDTFGTSVIGNPSNHGHFFSFEFPMPPRLGLPTARYRLLESIFRHKSQIA